jgi:hypothetical protein
VSISTRQAAHITGLVSAEIEEPIVAVAIFLRRGETASRMLGAFATGPSLGMWADSMLRAPNFPASTLVAVTDDAMHLFEAKGGFKWSVKQKFGEYTHGTYRAESDDRSAITRPLYLTFMDGSRAELEAQVSGAQRWQAAAIDALVERSGAPLPQA